MVRNENWKLGCNLPSCSQLLYLVNFVMLVSQYHFNHRWLHFNGVSLFNVCGAATMTCNVIGIITVCKINNRVPTIFWYWNSMTFQWLSRTLKLHFQGPILHGSLQHGQYYSNS